MNYWKKYIAKTNRKKILYLFIIFILMIYLGFKVDFSISRIILGTPSMLNLIMRMLSPNTSYISEVFGKLVDTLQLAIVSSIIGVALAIPFSLIVSRNISPNKFITLILNGFFSFIRTIPSLIWAAILVSIFSIGKFAGIIALTITAFSISLKLLRESIESINENILNSTISVGATKFQVLRYCVLPHIFELSISVFFMAFETNIRNATILGLVGAGGIGQIMWRDLNHLRYDNLSTLILILFITILSIDLLSLSIRNYLKKSKINYNSIDSFKRYKYFKLVFFPIIFIVLAVIIYNSLDITIARFVLGLGQGVDMLGKMLRIDITYLPKLMSGIKESLFIAMFATTIGSMFTLILSYFTAFNSSPNRIISLTFKSLINILRTFPAIITAIILFRGVGPGAMAGAIALSIYTTGMLTRLFSEVIESIPPNVLDSIKVTGASNLNIYRHGILPYTFPTFISLILYRFESNIRTSTILGVIGAGGIGTLLAMNITWRNWEKVGLLLLGISLIIILVDNISSYIRKVLR